MRKKFRVLSLLAGRKRRFSSLPLAGGWTKYRDLPAPAARIRSGQRPFRQPYTHVVNPRPGCGAMRHTHRDGWRARAVGAVKRRWAKQSESYSYS